MAPKTFYDMIIERLDELAIKPNAASLRATGGKNRDLVRKLRSTNQMPSAAHAAGLAEVLGWTVEDLIRARESGAPPAQSHTGSVSPSPVVLPLASDLALDVPVLGVCAASLAGAFSIDGPIDHVRRPPGLARARNVYALYVVGESMMPRHRPGELLFVSPDRPASAGDDVVIQTRDHPGAPIIAWLKCMKRRTEAAIFVEQLNPLSTIEFKLAQVVAVHRVLTTRELFGA